ncbi:MAG TPA: IMP dehydrogenase, partial [Vicinamibacteria bacterium]|nr:IMP dehydrogenase [Vicinamibacteria bacterium]
MADTEPLFVGKTFDDFLFRPQHSPVRTRSEVSLAMPLAAGLELALPVLGANMDTVVGEEMAKTLALEGGLGFLHRNASIADQAARVRYVKTRHSHVIDQPLLLERTATIAEARQLIRKFNASSFLIEEVKGSGKLAGILSHRDMPLDASSDARPVSDFMTPRHRLVTRPPSVSLEEAERAMFEHRVEKLPLLDEQGRVRGLVTMRDLKLYKQKPHSSKDVRGRLRVGAAVGATGDYLERAQALVGQEVDVLLLDVAHADSEAVARAVGELRAKVAKVPLVVGNVATGEAARRLLDLGVDAIKVGV